MKSITTRRQACAILLGLLLVLSGCRSSSFLDPAEVAGAPAMVTVDGKAHLWVLTKQEEVRQVGVGSSSRGSSGTRSDTFFHFDLQAFDAATARPAWKRRLLSLGDDEASGMRASRVIGSASSGRLLGQDDGVVWLLMDGEPWAVSAADGQVLADAAGLQERNPVLRGLLPADERHYGFDQGLMLLSADARPFVVRGPDLQAAPYQAPKKPTPPPDLNADGVPRIAPLEMPGEVPARQLILDGQWLGLYSEKEAADAAVDEWGDRYRYPSTILNEGSVVRRHFWRATITPTERLNERFDTLTDFRPVADSPVFLKGRFLKDLATGKPLVLSSPTGVAVWHSTRIDSDGRLAVSRLGVDLQPLWTTELPLSENSTSNPVTYWLLSDRLLVMGEMWWMDDGVNLREPHLVSVDMRDGSRQAWSLSREAPLP